MMERRPVASFEEAESYINDIPRFCAKNTMEDTKAFLRRLGDPDRKLRILHVAGTNGKGSVCAYMRSILEAAGYRVALFTSPHLVDIRERFVVGGEMISGEDFLRVFLAVYERLSDARRSYHPSYFEYLFFMAMIYFAEQEPDFCILETGLGGRLDATNSVFRKALSVITRIGLDHVEYLGDTVEKIAGEKACIMQAGAPAVYWDAGGAEGAVFREKAAELGVSACPVSKKDYRFLEFANKSIDFSVYTRYYNDISLILRTQAFYQMENAALAVRAIEELDRSSTVSAAHIREGVRRCFWAGRMEEVLPEIYLDGAHNADGVRAFLESVAEDGHGGSRALLFSAVRDKDYARMAGELAQSGLFTRIFLARMRSGRGVSLDALRDISGQYSEYNCRVYEGVPEAFCELLHSREQEERVYIAGSLYLAGEIKELLRDDQF